MPQMVQHEGVAMSRGGVWPRQHRRRRNHLAQCLYRYPLSIYRLWATRLKSYLYRYYTQARRPREQHPTQFADSSERVPNDLDPNRHNHLPK